MRLVLLDGQLRSLQDRGGGATGKLEGACWAWQQSQLTRHAVMSMRCKRRQTGL